MRARSPDMAVPGAVAAPPAGADATESERLDRGDGRVRCRLRDLVALRARRHGVGRLRQGRVRGEGAGPRLSPFRGRGMEYAESRPYSPGDDIRHLDWKLSARTGRLHSKVFQAERDRTSLVVLDTGPWMAFGTRVRFKSVQAARLAALFAWVAAGEGDRLAAMSTLRNAPALPPRGGERGVMRLLAALCRWQPAPGDPEARVRPVSAVLDEASRALRPGSRVLLAVDPWRLDEAAIDRMVALHRHHDLILALLADPLELEPPPRGRLPISDGGRTLWLDTGSMAVREAWQRELSGRARALTARLRRAGLAAGLVSPAEDVVEALAGLLHGRPREGRA